MAAAATLAGAGVRAQVVSFPSWDHFEQQPEDYRATVFPPGVPVLSIEAGSTFGWDRYADDAIGIDHFGASAPGAVAMEKFGFTADHVVERARALLGAPRWLTRGRPPHAAGDTTATKGAVPMTRLQELYDIGGQSPWLDNLRRDWLEDGQLAELSRSASAASRRTRPSSPTPSAARTPTTTSSARS